MLLEPSFRLLGIFSDVGVIGDLSLFGDLRVLGILDRLPLSHLRLKAKSLGRVPLVWW